MMPWLHVSIKDDFLEHIEAAVEESVLDKSKWVRQACLEKLRREAEGGDEYAVRMPR